MRLAEKQVIALPGEPAPEGEAARVREGDETMAPTASLTAELVRRSHSGSRKKPLISPQASLESAPELADSSPQLVGPDDRRVPDDFVVEAPPGGVRAQQAILEKAFEAPGPELVFENIEPGAEDISAPEPVLPEAVPELPELEFAEAPEQVFASITGPELVASSSQFGRAEFRSARAGAAHWSLRGGPSPAFWGRAIKDASIFTICFAVLVFAILQTL